MHKITILDGPVSLPAFVVLRLNADQTRRRLHVLDVIAGEAGTYRARAITHWKTGETLETDAEIPKAMHERVAVEGAPEPPKPKAKPKAKAK